MYPIPPASVVNIPGRSSQLRVRHLQQAGLINVNNTCCLISFLLCCHRMQLKIHILNDPANIRSSMFVKVLNALPSSNSFSLQQLILVWNTVLRQLGLRIGQNEDIQSLSDGIMRELPLPNTANGTPVMTRFCAQYVCSSCGHSEQNINDWITKSFAVIPILNVPTSPTPVSIGPLLTSFNNSTFNISCSRCGNNNVGSYQVERGVYTAVRLNRLDYTYTNIVRTRLSTARTPAAAENLLGRLVSCVAHIGDHLGGHYVSYHKCGNRWYRNNDDRRIQLINYHPFDNINVQETVNYLVYNNV